MHVHVAIPDPVTLADVAPTAMRRLGFAMPDADGIDLSPATVRNYLSNAITKIGARNRIDAIRIARNAGWL